jgi:hypothetical protein
VSTRLFVAALALVGSAALCVTVAGSVLVLPFVPLVQGAASPAGGPGNSDRVPQGMLELYEQAAATCPGLSWALLAAIGTVESSNGTSQLPGVHSGANYAGAEGPMQFEPSTFAEYDEPVPAGGADPPSPYDPVDSVYAAARLLCTNGAGQAGDVARAVFAYNHSTAYVDEVLALAGSYASSASR